MRITLDLPENLINKALEELIRKSKISELKESKGQEIP